MSSSAPSPSSSRPETPPALDEKLELTVVMPCLNEAETLEACIVSAQQAIRENGIAGEVVIADGGSTDGSISIAERSARASFTSRRRGMEMPLWAEWLPRAASMC